MSLRPILFASILMTMSTSMSMSADFDVQSSGDDLGAINVSLNYAKVLRLSKPAATVIIGNPEIADATVRDSRTIVLTGRGFGKTNMVILDQTGAPIIDERIAVSRDGSETLTVYRRASIQTLSCSPFCEQAYLTEAERESQQAQQDENNSGVN